MVAGLRNVDEELASRVADGLGIDLPDALPRVAQQPAQPEVTTSGALSLTSRPGDGSIRTRRVALLVADGVESDALQSIYNALTAEGAVATFVGHRLGAVQASGGPIEVESTMEATPSVLFDAVVLPGGLAAIDTMMVSGQVMEFITTQYRHCKPILTLGGSSLLLEAARIPMQLPDGSADPGLLIADGRDIDAVAAEFIKAIARHRHFERQSDPPMLQPAADQQRETEFAK
jgi:catalase